jgi:hypothetical protein
MPCVYFIHEKGHYSTFKIGMTKGEADYRKRKLQTGNPRDLVVFAIVEVDDAYGYETFLHRKFKAKNIRGEWFKISPRDIRKACTSHKGYDEKETLGCLRWCFPF